MLIQVIFFYFILTAAGAVLCLYAITDPNEGPKPSRQNHFPVGLAIFLLPVGSILCALGFAFMGNVLDSYLGSDAITGLAGLTGAIHGAVGGAVIGFALGLRRNRRLKANPSTAFPVMCLGLLARHYQRLFGP